MGVLSSEKTNKAKKYINKKCRKSGIFQKLQENDTQAIAASFKAGGGYRNTVRWETLAPIPNTTESACTF